MSTQHTPAPWKLDDRGWDGQFIYGTDERVPGTGLRFIAEVDLNYDGSEANARLIAAAPDLFDALQHIRRCIPLGGFAKIHHDSSTCEQIDAAIAKALGEKI